MRPSCTSIQYNFMHERNSMVRETLLHSLWFGFAISAVCPALIDVKTIPVLPYKHKRALKIIFCRHSSFYINQGQQFSFKVVIFTCWVELSVLFTASSHWAVCFFLATRWRRRRCLRRSLMRIANLIKVYLSLNLCRVTSDNTSQHYNHITINSN